MFSSLGGPPIDWQREGIKDGETFTQAMMRELKYEGKNQAEHRTFFMYIRETKVITLFCYCNKLYVDATVQRGHLLALGTASGWPVPSLKPEPSASAQP